jgi:maltooligosyltrehalose trehalohydrolase
VAVAGRPLEPEGDGCFAAELPVPPGSAYGFSTTGVGPLGGWNDGERADPCSRSQPDGLRGLSQVVDTRAFEWSAAVVSVPVEELLVYELHVGAFSPAGTFDGVVSALARLAELGVTAIELMPVATFPGERGWGYDGVLTYAPHRAYGGPSGLVRLVDAAHAAGLAVILDVVYNHVGPGAELLLSHAPYFSERNRTPWGPALDYGRSGVREWAIQNAELWVRDYRIDGLRLDATHAIVDDSQPHVLAELAERVHAVRPDALVIAEAAVGDRRPLLEWGHDAQWADELHNALHALLTGERDGYYAGYGAVADAARALADDPRLVVYAQDHDQVGNRAQGDRLPPPLRRVATACVLFAPQVPLVFMGDEYGETAPFQFFTDHDDPAAAEAARRGRYQEFAAFTGFSGADVLPDPQDLATFERSRLDPADGDDSIRAFYAGLIALRRRLPRTVELDVDERRRVLRIRRGAHELVADFANVTAELR